MKVSRVARRVALSFPSTILTAFGCALALFAYIAPENAVAQTGSIYCPSGYTWNGCECVWSGSPIIVDIAHEGFHLTSAKSRCSF